MEDCVSRENCMENYSIRVEHLSKSYKLYQRKSDRVREAVSLSGKKYHTLFHALDDISFDVKKGETIGIIGTNGSGKSTLLKILTGVIAQTGGTFEVHGRISALLELGTGFNGEYTGLQNIELNGAMMGFSPKEMEARRDAIIRFADIGEYIHQPVKNYSSGMFARLAFAVAISVEPEVLIVDEALSVGDVFFQGKCFRKFDELRKKGTSILFVSHDLNTVREMCSRVLWIEHGQQRMFGNCQEVCTAYFNAQMERMNRETEKNLKDLNAEQQWIDNEEAVAVRPRIEPSGDSVLSDKCEVISAYIKNRDGSYVREMKAGSDYVIGMVTRFHEALDQVITGFSMSNAKGIIVLAENTYSNSKKNFSVEAGDVLETTFAFTAPFLHRGTYEICPAVALGIQENHVNLSWLHGALYVELQNSKYDIAELGLDYQVCNKKINEIKLIKAEERD